MQEQSEPLSPPADTTPLQKSEPPKYTYWVALVLGLLSVAAVLYGFYLYFQSLNSVRTTADQVTVAQRAVTEERSLASPSPQPDAQPTELLTEKSIDPIVELHLTHTFPGTGFTVSYPADDSWLVDNNDMALYCETCASAHTIDLVMLNSVIYNTVDEYLEKDTLSSQRERTTLDGLEAVKGVQSGSQQAGGSFITTFFVYNGQGYLLTERYPGIMDAESFSDFPAVNPAIVQTLRVEI